MTRTVHDSMGPMEIPAGAYYGAQTARAIENFKISGLRVHPELLRAMANIKAAVATVHGEMGVLSREKADAIVRSAEEVAGGERRDSFPLDPFTAGAGTSIHMNVNEVIASRAGEILTGERGRFDVVHPNDDVNLGQSTNDVFPTAIRIATRVGLGRVQASILALSDSLSEKARAFDDVVKTGRTHLQDAAPVRLGQEFGAYASTARRWARRIGEAALGLDELGLGGTAVGTGLNSHPGVPARAIAILASRYGVPFRPSSNPFEAMQSQAPMVEASSSLRGFALDLLRISNDLRLLSSGPRTGLGEIRLPALQPGSSIMPGKVNPVIAEMTAMVCYEVCGCDTTIGMAAAAGQLELNVMMPVIAHDMLFAVDILDRAVESLDRLCIQGIVPDAERCALFASESPALATSLVPLLGYDRAAEIVKTALDRRVSVRTVVEESGEVAPEVLSRLLDPRRLTEAGTDPGAGGSP